MARRRLRGRTRSRREPKLWQKKLGDITTMIITGFLTYAVFRDDVPIPLWVVLAITVLCLWWLFLIPTYCDAVKRTNPSELCTRRVRGKFRGCEDHARDKRDAVFALLNMRNPGTIFRVGWRGPGILPQTTVAQAHAASNATRESWMLTLTAVSTIAAVAGAVFTAMFQ